MASQVVQTLFEELGIGPTNEGAIFDKIMQQRVESSGAGGGNAATFARLGAQSGQGASALGQSILGGLGSFFGKNKELTFSEGARKRVQDTRDAVVAQATGVDFDVFQGRRKTRKELQKINVPTTGDAFKDQMSALDEITRIAAQNGDFELVTKANSKRIALEKNELEMVSAEQGNIEAIRENKIEEQLKKESDSTGRTVTLTGDDIDGPHSKAIMNDDGTWTVVRPDGSVQQSVPGIDITFVTPQDKSKDRLFETFDAQMKNALQTNGMSGTALTKVRGNVADMGEQAGIIADMTDSMLAMFDPARALDLTADILIGADRLATLAGNISEVFARPNDKKNDSWAVTWGGKKVTEAAQAKFATSTDILDSYFEENGIDFESILPAHLKADSREAQLFRANIMQMAYLDARLQEPSNRGLSDSDIKNALTRIGVNTFDPIVFANRQKQILTRLNGKIDNLGQELAATSQIPQGEVGQQGSGGFATTIRGFVYQKPFIDKIRSELGRAMGSVNSLLSGQNRQPELSQLSLEDLKQQIADEEARQ